MTRNRIIVIIVAILVVGGIGAYVAYDQVLRGDAAPALALPSNEPASSSGTGAAGTTITAATAAGSWNVGSGSEAGYRVREQLANLPAESDAVGRTNAVTGTATLAASGDSVQLTTAAVNVDTTSIASDKPMRDNRLRTDGLQTDSFPTATFTLTTPVDIPANAFDGATVNVTLHGDLMLHGLTRTVDIPATAQIQGDQLQIQGATTFPLSDYGMVAPNVGGFVLSVADKGALEFLVLLDKA
jgi:polyisoprenoid-binding protein YceI